ncbi:MAG: TldD/PmbA family protein [Bryobacteraceae bacterium]|jgi:PmbA protein
MTSKESLELARSAVDQARKQGANQVAANVFSERSIEAEVRAGKLEKLQESARHGLSLAIYLEQRYSSHSTNDLRHDSLARFIGEAVAMTRYLAQDSFRSLPDPKYYAGQEKRDLNLVDPGYEKIDTAERVRLAKAIKAAALAQSDKIISVTAGYGDSFSQNVKVHSNGFEGEETGTSFSISAEVTVKDDQGGHPEDYAYAYTRHLKDLPEVASIGRESAQRALKKIGQRKIASGRYDLLVENRSASRVFGALVGAMTGRALQQKSSFLDGMLGQAVASEKLTVSEDPFVPAGQGSRLFDAEGIAARKRAVIDQGVLKTYYIDSYYGRKLGVEPTTGRPSNLVFDLGDKDLAAMVQGISKGILVSNFIGGNSNGTTGDFSFGIMGFYIENGALRQPVNEMNISGNLKDLWKQLAATGNDPFPYGGWRIPTLHFTGIQFSGL